MQFYYRTKAYGFSVTLFLSANPNRIILLTYKICRFQGVYYSYMTGNEYQKSAMRTCRSPNLNHAVFGLCSEAGEVSGIMQKVFQGHKFDKNHIVKELGDCLWMIAEACSALDITFEEVMDQNIEKLKKRYPDGFEEEKSLFRDKNDI